MFVDDDSTASDDQQQGSSTEGSFKQSIDANVGKEIDTETQDMQDLP